MLQAIFGIVTAVAFLGAVVSWFIAAINMFRTVANRKEGVPLMASALANPFNIVFRPHQLTQRGLEARRWFFGGLVGFLVCVGIAAVAGNLAGLK